MKSKTKIRLKSRIEKNEQCLLQLLTGVVLLCLFLSCAEAREQKLKVQYYCSAATVDKNARVIMLDELTIFGPVSENPVIKFPVNTRQLKTELLE